MHRHILKLGFFVFEARVTEGVNDITITLCANHTVHGYDPQTRESVDEWVYGIIRRPPGETRCIHVFDSQHIMTT